MVQAIDFRVKSRDEGLDAHLTSLPLLSLSSGVQTNMSDYSEAINKAADLVHRLAGPVCDDIGAMISDSIKPYRAKNFVNTLRKTDRILRDAALPANAVPTRLLFPIADASSIEDNETLQEMWAGLLATASQQTDAVSPSFIETLKQLTPDEARHLEVICQDSVRRYNEIRERNQYSFKKAERVYDGMMLVAWAFGGTRFNGPEELTVPRSVYPDSYLRLGLIRKNFSVTSSFHGRDLNRAMADEMGTAVDADVDEWYEFTEYAVRFLDACHGPLPNHLVP